MNKSSFHSNKTEQNRNLLKFQKIKAEHDKAGKMTIEEFAAWQGYKDYRTKEVNEIKYHIFISTGLDRTAALLHSTKDGPVVRIDKSLVDLLVDKKEIGAIILHELGHYFSRHKLKVEDWDIDEEYEADDFVVSKLDAEVLISALEKIKNKKGHSKELELRIKRLRKI